MRIFHLAFLFFLGAFPSSASATTSLAPEKSFSQSFGKAVHSVEFFLSFLVGYDFHVLDTEQKGLQVVGAGASRTGTKSIEMALSMMGHKVYDARSILQHHHATRWKDAVEEWKYQNRTKIMSSLVDDMEKLGYTATLDFPLFLFAVPIFELRPEAKVLLSVRDSPEAWFRSFQYIYEKAATVTFCRPWSWIVGQAHEMVAMSSSILKATHDIDFRYLEYPEDKMRYFPWYERLHPIEDNHPNLRKDQNIQMYMDHVKEVERSIPPDNLLVYNVKDGWRPWVAFFKISDNSMTSEDFPFVNDRATLDVLSQILDMVGLLCPIWALLTLRFLYGIAVRARKKNRVYATNKIKIQ